MNTEEYGLKLYKVFEYDGQAFSAWNKAIKWCAENQYSIGQMQANAPIAIMKGLEWDWIAKWRNLTQDEKNQADGILKGNFRNGNVEIFLK